MPINIHGKQYVTVPERVQAIHDDESVKNVSILTEMLGEKPVIFKATVITPKGTFTGYSAADPLKPIEKKTPYEVAETSAVGRALGFAGYGLADGIASADEIYKAIASPTEAATQAPALKSFCKLHGTEMEHGTSKKTGLDYWAHKIGGEYCFGKGTKTEMERRQRKEFEQE